MKTNWLTRTLVALFAIPLLWAGSALAQDRATVEEAQAMAEAAAAYYAEHGAEAAFEAFNTAPEFHDRDLYVFATDMTGTNVAHGTNPNLIGRTLIDLRDPSGRTFVRDMVEVEDRGWVDYQWQNPTTNAVEEKTSYIINVGDYVIGVGAYR